MQADCAGAMRKNEGPALTSCSAASTGLSEGITVSAASGLCPPSINILTAT